MKSGDPGEWKEAIDIELLGGRGYGCDCTRLQRTWMLETGLQILVQ